MKPQVGDIWFDKLTKHHLLVTKQHPNASNYFTYFILENGYTHEWSTEMFKKHCEFVS